ncbi:DEAD/DEAH box helicase [Desulfobacterota bacterium M19]
MRRLLSFNDKHVNYDTIIHAQVRQIIYFRHSAFILYGLIMIKRLFKLMRVKLSTDNTGRHSVSDREEAAAPQKTAARPVKVHEHPAGKPAEKKYRRPKTSSGTKTAPWDIKKFEVVPEPGKTRFHDLNLPLELMHAIADLGFQYCTPIQAETIAQTMKGADAIGQAQTGTGKSAAFLIAVMCSLLADKNVKRRKGAPRALIIAPTRELVMQIARDGQDLARYCRLNIGAVFGGMDYEKQQREIEGRPIDILAATPGRLIDFQRRRIVDLSAVKTMVIDEADRMLDMGFIPDVRRIVNSTPARGERQTLMFSATITTDVQRLASQWCKNPIKVEVAAEDIAVDTVEQIIYLATAEEKYNILYNMVVGRKLDKVLVFTNRRDETRRLTERLTRNNISCDMLSGDVAQKKRMTTLENFRNGRLKVLVATDVAGRGIHIDGISHVFNYFLPYEPEDYVHRIGRTGRAGHHGTAISFADEEAAFYLPDIEKYIDHKLKCVYPDDELLVPPPRGTGKPAAKKNKGQGGSRHYKHGSPRRGGSNRGHRRPVSANTTRNTPQH